MDLEMNAPHLIGMTIDKARDLYGRCGFTVRCIKADGTDRVVTGDVMPTRINVETENGVITKVRNVG